MKVVKADNCIDMSSSLSSLPKCFMPGCQDVDLFVKHVSLNKSDPRL